MYLVLDLLSKQILKMNTKQQKKKTCQMSNKCGISNLTFPNGFVFQRLLFFMNVLNRLCKLYDQA